MKDYNLVEDSPVGGEGMPGWFGKTVVSGKHQVWGQKAQVHGQLPLHWAVSPGQAPLLL